MKNYWLDKIEEPGALPIGDYVGKDAKAKNPIFSAEEEDLILWGANSLEKKCEELHKFKRALRRRTAHLDRFHPCLEEMNQIAKELYEKYPKARVGLRRTLFSLQKMDRDVAKKTEDDKWSNEEFDAALVMGWEQAIKPITKIAKKIVRKNSCAGAFDNIVQDLVHYSKKHIETYITNEDHPYAHGYFFKLMSCRLNTIKETSEFEIPWPEYPKVPDFKIDPPKEGIDLPPIICKTPHLDEKGKEKESQDSYGWSYNFEFKLPESQK